MPSPSTAPIITQEELRALSDARINRLYNTYRNSPRQYIPIEIGEAVLLESQTIRRVTPGNIIREYERRRLQSQIDNLPLGTPTSVPDQIRIRVITDAELQALPQETIDQAAQMYAANPYAGQGVITTPDGTELYVNQTQILEESRRRQQAPRPINAQQLQNLDAGLIYTLYTQLTNNNDSHALMYVDGERRLASRIDITAEYNRRLSLREEAMMVRVSEDELRNAPALPAAEEIRYVTPIRVRRPDLAQFVEEASAILPLTALSTTQLAHHINNFRGRNRPDEIVTIRHDGRDYQVYLRELIRENDRRVGRLSQYTQRARNQGITINETNKETIMAELYPFQKEGAKKLADNNRYLLADEMGLGKSVQAIKAAALANLKHILVVCPAGLRFNWEREIKTWERRYQQTTVLYKKLPNNSRGWSPTETLFPPGFEAYWVIVSYDFLVNPTNAEYLKALTWDVIVADEAQYLNKWTAKRTHNFIKILAPRQPRIWLLTGTPATNSAADYHPLLSLLEPGQWGKFGDFQKAHCNEIPNNYGPSKYRYTGFKNQDVIREAFKRTALRRLKKDVLTQLPAKIETIVPVELNAKFAQASKAVKQTLLDMFVDDAEPEVSDSSITQLEINEFATLRHDIGVAKIDGAVAFLETSITKQRPWIVFGWHREVIESIADKLKAKGFRTGKILGGTTDTLRKEYVTKFQNGELDVIVLSLGAASLGITLTRSSHMLFVEQPFSPSVLNQAEDRAHRIGQDNPVNIYTLIAKGTIDEKVQKILKVKRRGMAQAFTPARPPPSAEVSEQF